MPTGLYDLSVPPFARGLRALSGILDKARDHARALDVDPESYLALRIIDDMHPFARQVELVCDGPRLAIGRLSGIEAPSFDDPTQTLDALQARIHATLAYLDGIPREAVDGQEAKAIVLAFPGGEMRFEGQAYLTGFAVPNFYFHLTTAYALLRGQGVPLGKRDYMGRPS